MQMRPVKSFLFIFTISILLLTIPLFFPEGKIRLAGLEVKFYKPIFLNQPRPELLMADEVLPKKAQPMAPEPAQQRQVFDLPGEVVIPAETKNVLPGKISATVHPAAGATDIAIPAELSNQWARLHEVLSNADMEEKPLRILYYGDSQIENDRITSVFRKVIQERYGGAGRGLIPVSNIYNSANNFVMSVSGNWESASVIKTKQANLDLGLLCEAFKIRHPGISEDESTRSWVKIKSLKGNQTGGYSALTIYYRTGGQSEIALARDGNQPLVKKLEPGDQISELRFDLGSTPESLEIGFTTNSEITVYGLNLESPGGVMVDNIALRGRSAPEFSRIDSSRLKQMARLLNPAVVVLQYGVNVVPNITSNYSFYKKQLNNELAALREIIPGIPVLLVSVSDMAHKANGLLESYPNLEAILNTQKETAQENGCAFWNLFESMGGKGSMISWVEKQPPLGNKDYVHYTPLGADKVGNLFARQLIKVLEPEQEIAFLAHEP